MLKTPQAAAFTALVTFPLSAFAQQDGSRLTALATQLSIPEAQVQSCLPDSVQDGQRPSNSERQALMNCLKAFNPSLSNKDIRAAMRSARGS